MLASSHPGVKVTPWSSPSIGSGGLVLHEHQNITWIIRPWHHRKQFHCWSKGPKHAVVDFRTTAGQINADQLNCSWPHSQITPPPPPDQSGDKQKIILTLTLLCQWWLHSSGLRLVKVCLDNAGLVPTESWHILLIVDQLANGRLVTWHHWTGENQSINIR